MIRKYLLLLLSVSFLSCATDMTSRATRVRIVNVEQVHQCETECEFLGNVKGRAFPGAGLLSWWGVGRSLAYNNALDELLDNAAELGATHVFIDFGDYHELRGEAYRCYICIDKNGQPDTDKCVDINGKPDKAVCLDKEGRPFGIAHCEGADASTLIECLARGGKWIPSITEDECKKKGYKWVPEAKNRAECEAKGKIWLPKAKDKATCEAKGGRWVPNRDVLKVQIPTEEAKGR